MKRILETFGFVATRIAMDELDEELFLSSTLSTSTIRTTIPFTQFLLLYGPGYCHPTVIHHKNWSN